jgi:pimeloyl-ACP methyl ester carboxylesterase
MKFGRFIPLFFVMAAAFLTPLRHVDAQNRIDTWTTDNGLPQNSVTSLTRTPDGYIWFTTNDGLVRFDGVRFKVFNKSKRSNMSTKLGEKMETSMRRKGLSLLLLVIVVGLTIAPAYAQRSASSSAASRSSAARLPEGFSEKTANVDGVKINYKIGGKGPVVVLLHGYTQTSHMWQPLMPLLATSHTVIAPDLRGAGDSERTPDGYDKKTLAKDIRGLVHQLGYQQAQIVGHDIGLMVAYAYAAQYPGEVTKVVLMDAFLPGVGNWKDVWLLRDLWHFHFYGETPEALVKGRERIYFEHFWNDFAADRNKSVPEADRRLYAALKVYPGFPHGMCTTNPDQINADLSRSSRLKAGLLTVFARILVGAFLRDAAPARNTTYVTAWLT